MRLWTEKNSQLPSISGTVNITNSAMDGDDVSSSFASMNVSHLADLRLSFACADDLKVIASNLRRIALLTGAERSEARESSMRNTKHINGTLK